MTVPLTSTVIVLGPALRDSNALVARAQQLDRMRLIVMLMGFAESDPAILDLGADQHV
jgi:hypothetical protein